MIPRIFFVLITSALLAINACQSDYEKMVSRELASGIRHDSLFLGLHFGMTRDSFYRHCFRLNGQGLVTNGPQNNTVLYVINGYRYPIDMNFYPEFEQEKIYKMPVVFNYQAWAPWTKDLFADKLVPDVLDLLTRWYGPGFLAKKAPNNDLFWVKVDGNRQILVLIQNERNVRVEISDLTVHPTPKPRPTPAAGDKRPVWEKSPAK